MNERLAVLHRIQHELRRQLGTSIDLERMQGSELYARDVLLVCDALAGTELPALARLYRDGGALAPRQSEPAGPQPPGHQPVDAAWSGDTSGFGTSGPIPLDAPAAPERRRGWHAARRWFGL